MNLVMAFAWALEPLALSVFLPPQSTVVAAPPELASVLLLVIAALVELLMLLEPMLLSVAAAVLVVFEVVVEVAVLLSLPHADNSKALAATMPTAALESLSFM